ncbi:MAG: restriction endonuclease subunit S [Nostoc sp.]|uniref:restriction endonuclease subunit S n=1 Tax=Nostoc sp. TaxID=1180 RepID=UPI002FF4222A
MYVNANYPPTPLRQVISRVQYGTSSLSTEEPVGLPIIRMNNLQNDGWDFTNLKYIDLSEKEAEVYRLNPGDILFNRTNSKELVGKCEVFRESGHWVFASYLIRVSLDHSRAISDFVSAFLNTKSGRAQIDRVSRQIIGMSNVNAEELQDLLIPLPPLNIQRSLISELEAARQSRKQKLAQADELLSSINDYFITQLGLTSLSSLSSFHENKMPTFAVKRNKLTKRLDVFYHKPEFYLLENQLHKLENQIVSLKNLSIAFTNGDHGGLTYTESGIRYLRGQSVIENGLELTNDELYISLDDHQRMIRSEVIPGDVLLTIAGSIGNSCVVRGIERANINQAIVKIRPISSVDPDYLAVFLNSDYGKLQTRRLANGAVQLNVNFSEVEDIKVLLPDLEVQRSLVAEIEKRRTEARQLRQKAEAEWEAAKSRFERKLLGEEG